MARFNAGINRPAKKTAIIASLLGTALVAAGALFSITAAQAEDVDCGEWQPARATTEFLERNDLYRICGDRMEVLVIEDDHETLSIAPALQ